MSDHMKRLAAPKSWPLKRKVAVWVAKQSPGAHSLESSLPAIMVLRDIMGVCDTAKEAKRIIGNREVFVDGKAVKNPKAPIGLMDVVTIPKMGLMCRMLLTDKGKLTMVAIPEAETKWKLCRVEGKTKIAGGRIQVNLSGGRNLVLDSNKYSSGDTLKLSVDGQEVLGCYPMTDGAVAMIIDGSLAGKIDTISECVVVEGPSENVVRFKSETETVKRNVFVIGTGSAEIKLPEASE